MSEVSSTALGLHSRAVLEIQFIVFLLLFLDRPWLVEIFFSFLWQGSKCRGGGGGGRGGTNLENRLKTKKIVACTHTVSSFITCFIDSDRKKCIYLFLIALRHGREVARKKTEF